MSQVDRSEGLVGNTAIKAPVRCATTGNITLNGEQTVDGVAVVTGDRVLVKNQTDATQNGIWVCDTGDWNRGQDFDGNLDVVQGTIVMCTSGSTNSNTYWRQATANSIVLETTAITFDAALASDSALLAFLQAGTGAELRSSQSKMRDWVSVFDFMNTAQIADVQARTYSENVSTAIAKAIAAAKYVIWLPGGYLGNIEVGEQHCVLFSPYPHAVNIKAANNALDVIKFNRPVLSNGWIASVIGIDTQGGLNGIHVYGGYVGANSLIDEVTCRTFSNAGFLIDSDPTDFTWGSTWIYGRVGRLRIEGSGAGSAYGIRAVGYNMINATEWGQVSIANVVTGVSIVETVSTGLQAHFTSLTVEETQNEAIQLTGTVMAITSLYDEKIGSATNTADINLSSEAGGMWRAKVIIETVQWGSKLGASAANINRIHFSTNFCTADVRDMPAVGTYAIDGNNSTAGAFIYLSGYANNMTVVNFSNNEIRTDPQWGTVAFSAGNFTGGGAQTWTLTSPDQVTFTYQINSKTMTVSGYFVATSVGGTPHFELRITIPLGKIAAATVANACHANDNGTGVSAYAKTTAGATYISVIRDDNANWAAAADTTDVQFQIAFEIQ